MINVRTWRPSETYVVRLLLAWKCMYTANKICKSFLRRNGVWYLIFWGKMSLPPVWLEFTIYKWVKPSVTKQTFVIAGHPFLTYWKKKQVSWQQYLFLLNMGIYLIHIFFIWASLFEGRISNWITASFVHCILKSNTQRNKIY